jgi:hypothetical protein
LLRRLILRTAMRAYWYRLVVVYWRLKVVWIAIKSWFNDRYGDCLLLTCAINRFMPPNREFAVWQVMGVLAAVPLLFLLLLVQVSHQVVAALNPAIRLEEANNRVVPHFPELAPVFQAWEQCNRDLNPTWAKCDAIAYPVAQKNGLAGRFVQYQTARGDALAELERPLRGSPPPPK